MTKTKKIGIIAAHPDDEILGCGGAVAKHVKNGDEVHVLIVAEGITARDTKRDVEARKDGLEFLSNCSKRANEILGVSSLTMNNFPDNRMDSIERLDVIKLIEKFIKNISPEVIYTHFVNDVNIDHRRVHDSVIAACRQLPGSIVKRLLFFEIASSTEWRPPLGATFSPNWFVDVSDTLSTKLKALEAYNSEMRDFPHPRSLKALEYLSRWRGATIGVDAAEAFVLGRNVE
ncbi:PIG-L family deacetylase [Candidatus Babeliales bacterium]|nr:PIG-L family deacetylase [Candidatus Babeliales bacterium]